MRVTMSYRAMLASIKILIVDDQPHMRKVLTAMLSGLGATKLFVAVDGAAALAKIVDDPPDLILVDWDMPLMDGLQFIQQVRAPGRFPFPDIPIIMLTGHAEKWRVVEAARLGVHEFLMKPVSTASIAERIKVALDRRPMVNVQGNYIPSPRRLFVLDVDEPNLKW